MIFLCIFFYRNRAEDLVYCFYYMLFQINDMLVDRHYEKLKIEIINAFKELKGCIKDDTLAE